MLRPAWLPWSLNSRRCSWRILAACRDPLAPARALWAFRQSRFVSSNRGFGPGCRKAKNHKHLISRNLTSWTYLPGPCPLLRDSENGLRTTPSYSRQSWGRRGYPPIAMLAPHLLQFWSGRSMCRPVVQTSWPNRGIFENATSPHDYTSQASREQCWDSLKKAQMHEAFLTNLIQTWDLVQKFLLWQLKSPVKLPTETRSSD